MTMDLEYNFSNVASLRFTYLHKVYEIIVIASLIQQYLHFFMNSILTIEKFFLRSLKAVLW